jgi:hypothetical protein
MSPNLQKTVFMMQTELTKKTIAQVGEAINHELGARMIQDYQLANANDTKSYLIGRDIIEQLLNQPNCVGIKFLNAYNEKGKKTLVYVGVDESGKSIAEFTTVDNKGNLRTEQAIVADRVRESDEDSLWDTIREFFS